MTDHIFDAIADDYRRQLLLNLRENESQTIPALSGVTREIADGHDDLLCNYLSGSRTLPEVDETVLQAHFVHLPKLAEYGFIEWERDENVVTRGPRFDDLRPALALVAEEKDELVAAGSVERVR